MVVGSGLSARVGDLGVDEVVNASPGDHRPSPSRRVDLPLQLHHLRQSVGQVQQWLELLPEEVRVDGYALAKQAFGGATPDRGAALLVGVQPSRAASRR